MLLSTSTPSAESLSGNLSQQAEDFTETSSVQCQSCGVEAKPYSRFCEACGNKLGVGKSEQSASVQATVQANPKVETPSAQLPKPEARRSSATIFEPKPPKSSIPTLPVAHTDSAELTNARFGSLPVDPALAPTSPMPEARNDVESNPKVITQPGSPASSGQSGKFPAPDNPSGKLSSDESVFPKTVVTPLPPFGGEFRHKDSSLLSNNQARNRQAMIQAAVLIGVVSILILFVWWWFNRDTTGGLPRLPSISQTNQAPAPRQSNSTGSTATVSSNENMIFIPGGKFQMGRVGGDEYETPVRTITVSPFFIARTEVTNQEYQRFVTDTGHRAPPHWQNGKFPANEANLPVVNVSWDDASDFAKWAGKRLPTEIEWEFAARGTEARLYPWGNNWNTASANAGRETGGRVSEVGRFPNGASPFGVLDLCGNVWEWTSSNLVSYADNKVMAPGKVIRGGAFNVPSERATTTYRGVLPPERLGDKTGFRLAQDGQSTP